MTTTETPSIIARAQLRPQEIRALQALAVCSNTREAAAHLGITRSAIQSQLWRIRACLAVVTEQQHWTAEELADLTRKEGLANEDNDER